MSEYSRPRYSDDPLGDFSRHTATFIQKKVDDLYIKTDDKDVLINFKFLDGLRDTPYILSYALRRKSLENFNELLKESSLWKK